MNDDLDYVIRCPVCQRIVGWFSGKLNAKELAAEVARLIRAGLSVERMETEAARAAAWGHAEDCPMKPPKAKRPRRQTRMFP